MNRHFHFKSNELGEVVIFYIYLFQICLELGKGQELLYDYNRIRKKSKYAYNHYTEKKKKEGKINRQLISVFSLHGRLLRQGGSVLYSIR